MTWLAATPKPHAGSKRAAKQDAETPRLSRRDQMKKDGIKPQMPPNPMPHIIERLLEIGLTEAAGMGVGPVSWPTIDAWVSRTGIDLAAWEARLFRHLSVEYVAESHRAESENCPAPWRGEITQQERDAELRQLKSVLG